MKSVVNYLQRKSLEDNNQGQLAKYILNSDEDIYELKIRDLAEKAYVSPPTVIRLAQGAGFKGFNEFKYELRSELENIKKQETQYTNFEIDNYINNYMKTLLDTSNGFDYNLIIELAENIASTNEVVIFAIGSTLLRAMDFEYKLRRLGIKVISCMDFDLQKAQSKTINANTTVMAITYSGEKDQVNKCVNNVINNQVNCFLISTIDKFNSQYIKHIKIAQSEPLSRNFSINSVASISFILDLIFLELLKCNPHKYRATLSNTKQ